MRNNKLETAIARKSAELAALELKAVEEEAARKALRVEPVRIKLHLTGAQMKGLNNRVEDVEGRSRPEARDSCCD